MTEKEWLSCDEPKRLLDLLDLAGSVALSERKARLFVCAACRRFSRYIDEEHCRKAVEFGRLNGLFEGRDRPEPSPACCLRALEMEEACAEVGTTPPELEALAEECATLYFVAGDYCACYVEGWGPYDGEMMATCAVADALAEASLRGSIHRLAEAATELKTVEFGVEPEGAEAKEKAALCVLLREMIPNPFQPAAFQATWRSARAVPLAQTAYDEREAGSGHLDRARLAVLADALEETDCTDDALLSHLRSPGPHIRGCWAVDLVLGLN